MNFFSSIAQFFSLIWEFLSNIVQSALTAFSVIQVAVVVPESLLAVVPSVLGSCIIIVMAVGVLKLILGWGNQ